MPNDRESRICRKRLVLISKGNGNLTTSSAYRLLCTLDTAGKLLEKMLKSKLERFIEDAKGRSNRQHDFRRRPFTISSASAVVQIFQSAQRMNHYSRFLVLLDRLDVRDVFNSVRWGVILDALENRIDQQMVPQIHH